MTHRPSRLLVGIGQVLRHDDGVGVRAAEVLAARPRPEDVEIYDAGLAALELAAVIEGRELVVAVDAVEIDAPPGTVFRLDPDELRPLVTGGLSLHDVHFLDALEETRLLGTAPERVVILAVRAGDVSPGIGLSPPVEAALPRVVELAARELGLPRELRQHPPTMSAWSA